MSIGERLREARLVRGQTQDQAAHELGVSFVALNRWERGHQEPTGLYREAVDRYIARALGKNWKEERRE